MHARFLLGYDRYLFLKLQENHRNRDFAHEAYMTRMSIRNMLAFTYDTLCELKRQC